MDEFGNIPVLPNMEKFPVWEDQELMCSDLELCERFIEVDLPLKLLHTNPAQTVHSLFQQQLVAIKPNPSIETIDDLDEFMEQSDNHSVVIADSLYVMNEAVRETLISTCKDTVFNKSSWRWMTNLLGPEHINEIKAELAATNTQPESFPTDADAAKRTAGRVSASKGLTLPSLAIEGRQQVHTLSIELHPSEAPDEAVLAVQSSKDLSSTILSPNTADKTKQIPNPKRKLPMTGSPSLSPVNRPIIRLPNIRSQETDTERFAELDQSLISKQALQGRYDIDHYRVIVMDSKRHRTPTESLQHIANLLHMTDNNERDLFVQTFLVADENGVLTIPALGYLEEICTWILFREDLLVEIVLFESIGSDPWRLFLGRSSARLQESRLRSTLRSQLRAATHMVRRLSRTIEYPITYAGQHYVSKMQTDEIGLIPEVTDQCMNGLSPDQAYESLKHRLHALRSGLDLGVLGRSDSLRYIQTALKAMPAIVNPYRNQIKAGDYSNAVHLHLEAPETARLTIGETFDATFRAAQDARILIKPDLASLHIVSLHEVRGEVKIAGPPVTEGKNSRINGQSVSVVFGDGVN